LKYSEDSKRSERKTSRERLNRKARKNFKKDYRKFRNQEDIDRREKRKQQIENETEFLNTGTE